MRFLSSYVWRQQEKCALVLQQARRKKGGLPVLLAGVCEDGDFAGELAEWFHESALPRCRRGAAERAVENVWEHFSAWMDHDGARGAFALLFCAGEECFYAWRGDMEIRALNTQFGRAQARSLTRWTENYGCERAVLEENVGLLLGAGDFFRRLPEEALRSCLAVSGLNSQQQADRHLEEACGEALRRGAENTAAIAVLTKGNACLKRAEGD